MEAQCIYCIELKRETGLLPTAEQGYEVITYTLKNKKEAGFTVSSCIKKTGLAHLSRSSFWKEHSSGCKHGVYGWNLWWKFSTHTINIHTYTPKEGFAISFWSSPQQGWLCHFPTYPRQQSLTRPYLCWWYPFTQNFIHSWLPPLTLENQIHTFRKVTANWSPSMSRDELYNPIMKAQLPG